MCAAVVPEEFIMKSLRNLFKFKSYILAVLMGVFFAGHSHAATVHSCTGTGERCIVKVEDGMVGDRVKILDDKARPIASGRIVKRRGAFAVVSIKDPMQTIRKGYPVIVNIDSRSSSLQWAASFTSQD